MPETVKQILKEIAIGAVVGVMAAIAWVLIVGSAQVSPWTFFVVSVIVMLAAGFLASVWSHRQDVRRSKGASQ